MKYSLHKVNFFVQSLTPNHPLNMILSVDVRMCLCVCLFVCLSRVSWCVCWFLRACVTTRVVSEVSLSTLY